ncbi:MAG: M23 family metallopeptidase [bacterium]|nr:M23 family metallopeptidase [bacterium]
MTKRDYTILMIPSDKSGTRRFTLSRRFLVISSVVLMALMGLSGILIMDRIHLESKVSRLIPLEERAAAQSELLDRFRNRLRQVDQQLGRLRSFESQLRVMASLQPNKRNNDLGVGGVSKGDIIGRVGKLGPGERRLAFRLDRQFKDIESRAEMQKDGFGDLLRAFREKRVSLAHTPSILPVKGWLTSGFGRRKSAFTGRQEFHSGIDIVARRGTPITAPADGIVIKARREVGYGKTVEIRHMQGIITRFAHNHKLFVQVGQRVQRGDVIAAVGSTGRSTGPHLHYEVRLNGIAVNPLLYIVDWDFARR